jgi:hypothetical protein
MATTSFRAGESISAGQAVYVQASGLIYKANGTNATQASVAGVAIDNGALGSLIRVQSDAVYATYSGLTPGEFRYLSILTSGQLVSYSSWASELNSTALPGAYLTNTGRCVSASGLSVEIQPPIFVTNPV